MSTINPATSIGSVHLKVSDIERSIDFYRTALGFKVHERGKSMARLGAGGEELLILHEVEHARHVRRATGLYHFAILVPTRKELADSLQRLLVNEATPDGFADHLVSEAIYLSDPDGIGIEIYRDRPRDQWPVSNGQIQMATDPLDLKGIMAERDDSQGSSSLPSGTTIGHIHLQVSDIKKSEMFYTTIIGFDFVASFGASAGFVSAGGYHHHIGYNTWAGTGIPALPADAAGLEYFTVRLPSRSDLEQLKQRLESHQWPYEIDEDALRVSDPSSIEMRFVVQ